MACLDFDRLTNRACGEYPILGMHTRSNPCFIIQRKRPCSDTPLC